jgi:hypothetical protein
MNPTPENLEAATPPTGQDWDPAAALTRLAGHDVAGFTARLHRAAEAYARSGTSHLSFEEMQDVVRGDPSALTRHADHLATCEFCAGLRETLNTPDAAKRAFAELVERYERPQAEPDEPVRPRPAPQPSRGGGSWRLLPHWGLAATAAVGGIALGTLGTLNLQQRVRKDPIIELPQIVREQPAAPQNKPDWTDVRDNCTEQSGHPQSCNLLADAARLQADGKPQSAQPLVVKALTQSGVNPGVVAHVDRTLDTPPAADPSARAQAASEAQVALAKVGKSDDAWLQVAKSEFAAGHPVAGYESLAAYVATANASAGKALQVGFVEPMKGVTQYRPGEWDRAGVASPAAASASADASAAVAAAAAASSGTKDAKN